MPGRFESRIWPHNPAADAPPRHRRACQYQVHIPDPLRGLGLTLSGELAGAIADAESAIAALNRNARPALAPLSRLLLRTESIASSKVEGMQLDVRELALAEARAESGGKIGPSALEILANIDSMSLAIDEAATVERFAIAQILTIHRQLMTASPTARNAGQLRTVQNWIGGNDYTPCSADFVPPPPELVDQLLADLVDAINDDLLPPLVQAALVHAHFETIHPFDDGNGRTGRALIHVILRRRGIAPDYVPPISVLFARERERYVAGLTAYRSEDIRPWIEQFASTAASAARLAASYLGAVRNLTERWRSSLAATPDPPRADAAAWAVIDILPAHPILTAPLAAAATGRAKPGIYQALESLEAAGVLRPVARGKRYRSWEAAGLLDLVADLEDGRVPADS